MKIPAPKGVITMFGDQQEARNIEKDHTPGQTNIYQLNSPREERKPYIEAKQDKEEIEIARGAKECRVHIFKNDSNSSSPSTSEEHFGICG
jgi:hypothetical protein